MNKEYNNFKSFANQWWDENGKFSVLHKINPIRINYILKQISKIKNQKSKNKNYLNKIKIIDVGCGGGLVCEPLARLGAKVSGLDFVKKNIQVAKKHAFNENLNINYFVSDINNIKLNERYDIILLLEVIEHIDNWKKIINKLNYCLKPGGIIIISSINRNLLSAVMALFVAEKILKWIPRGTHNYNKLIKPSELINTLKKNKFKTIDLTGMTYNPVTREWYLSKNNTLVNYFCTAQKIN